MDGDLRQQLNKQDKEAIAELGVKIYFWDELYPLGELKDMSVIQPSKDLRNSIAESDPLMLIFTSGTTGLPKASKISHSRFFVGVYMNVNSCKYSYLCLYIDVYILFLF